MQQQLDVCESTSIARSTKISSSNKITTEPSPSWVESSRACWFKSQLSAAILNATFEWKFAGYSLLLLFVLLYAARSIQLIFCGHWSILPGLIPTTMLGRLDHKSTCNDLRSSCCYCTNCVDHSASRSVEFGPCGSLKNTYFKSSTFVRAKQAFFKRPKASLTTK